ncbi:MAG TPA: hypothetical protein VE463_14310 [Blastococcus sp.]|nr:hypothetical protein [Blastococcus sp.]
MPGATERRSPAPGLHRWVPGVLAEAVALARDAGLGPSPERPPS